MVARLLLPFVYRVVSVAMGNVPRIATVPVCRGVEAQATVLVAACVIALGPRKEKRILPSASGT